MLLLVLVMVMCDDAPYLLSKVPLLMLVVVVVHDVLELDLLLD